ncbi:DMT family transporter [Tepidibacter aestuarii]|uniref:DMT family transporter n=1 Tax=Tepidibacter aestuarii TaxID=2925782 RepID=UPI0020BF5E68|nr:DMT family transporter [Tepidibacter aestuarii]CAH2211998.1 Permeases of the drug/metabolite transporter (DMT) superfamily [Tepidibacter aestuarii]
MDLKSAKQSQMELELSHAKKGIGFGIFSGASWGLSGVLLGIALGMAPFTNGISLYAAPLAGAALHDGFAAFWVFLVNLFNGKWKEYGRTLSTKPGKIVCLAALFGGPIGMSGYLLGINLAGTSYALSITATYPALGAILGVIILKEKISPRVWFGIFCCIVGAIIVGYVPPEGGNYPHFYLGLGLSLLAAFGWATEGVLSTYGMDMVDPDISIGIREATSFIVYLVAILPLVAGFPVFFNAFKQHSLYFVALAGLAGGLSYIGWYRALNTTGVSRAMAFNITYALWSVLFGWLFTDLQITLNLIIGCLVITLGTLLVSANPKDLLNLRNKE